MIRGTTKIQKTCWIVFIVYLFAIFYFTIFAESMGRVPGDVISEPRYNLIPFAEIKRFIVYRRQLGMKAFMLNVVGNCIAFMPCGFLLPAVSRRCRSGVICVLIGFFVSFFIECTQLIFRVGSFDVDDLLLNTLGVLLGFVINRSVQYYRIKQRKKLYPREVNIRKVEK